MKKIQFTIWTLIVGLLLPTLISCHDKNSPDENIENKIIYASTRTSIVGATLYNNGVSNGVYRLNLKLTGEGFAYNDTEEDWAGKGYILNIKIYSSSPEIEPGIYTYSKNKAAGSFSLMEIGYYDSETEEFKEGRTLFSQGTIDVSTSESGYELTIQGKDDNDQEIKVHYSGTLRTGVVPEPPARTEQTVFMYLPWSSNLTSYFYNNVADLKSVIEQGVLKKERVVVYFATSSTEADLYELVYKDDECVEEHLKSYAYTTPEYTTANGITSILNDVQAFSPTDRYAMIIGCHGMGWLPVNGISSRSVGQKMHWEYEGALLTRYFGGTSSQYQTDITTLAKGITNTGLKMEYILFDDCYLSTVEVAYDLKEATDYIIACPTEIMAYGMPYAKIGQYLIGKVDYQGIADGFYSFYSNYSMPCGTIGITKCAELDNLATVMKEINSRFTFNTSLIGNLQRLDGYTPVIFFDYGDYVAKLCNDNALLAKFEAQLALTVPTEYRKHTEYYYSSSKGKVKINTYSGITISDPSQNTQAIPKTKTAWYKATH